MERYRKICFPIILALIFLPQGCSTVQNSQKDDDQAGLSEMLRNDSVARRFQESSTQKATAVDSAIELSEKYAKLTDEASMLRQQNNDLVTRNQLFEDQVAALEKQLRQTQKELAEANEVLIEMRVELNNWKSDVIGFREEMRDAESAQLEALLKILHVLGGEIRTETTSAQNGTVGSADTTVASLGNSR
jgi:chromosome segregation ATPase